VKSGTEAARLTVGSWAGGPLNPLSAVAVGAWIPQSQPPDFPSRAPVETWPLPRGGALVVPHGALPQTDCPASTTRALFSPASSVVVPRSPERSGSRTRRIARGPATARRSRTARRRERAGQSGTPSPGPPPCRAVCLGRCRGRQ